MQRTIPAGTRLRIGEPAVEPDEVLAQVRYALGDVPAVLAARRAWVQVGDSAPSLALGLSLTADASPAQVLPAVRDALDDILRRSRPGFAVDLVVLDGSTDPIASWMDSNAAPFYTAA